MYESEMVWNLATAWQKQVFKKKNLTIMKNVNNLCKTWQTSCVDFLLSSSHEAHITIQCKLKKGSQKNI